MSARELIERMEENATREREEQERQRSSPFAMSSALAAALVGLPGLFVLILGVDFMFDDAGDGFVALGFLGIGLVLTFAGVVLGVLALATRNKKRST
jgi:F0F1-type ATP synthase assembly protein I